MSDDIEPVEANDQLILISGYSGDGKSASLRNIRDQPDWLYGNTEAGKRLPFKSKFFDGGFRISDPYQVIEMFDYGIDTPEIKGIIVDSLTFLLEMYETQYVLGTSNTMAGWSNFQQYFKQLMQEKVILFNRPTIFTAHLKDELDEKTMSMKTHVPVKGALKNNGIEAYFSTVVSAKKVDLKTLEKYGSDLLTITEEEEELGYKHVFQTRITKDTVGERIRSPMGMFTREQTFIDNDVQLLLDHLHAFYN